MIDGFMTGSWPGETHPHATLGARLRGSSKARFFPIPPDVLMIPMYPRSPQRWHGLSSQGCAVASVFGRDVGLAIRGGCV